MTDVTLPPGRESPDGFDRGRAMRGFGDYFGFPADSDLGRAYAHYEDKLNEFDLADRLEDYCVFAPYFHPIGKDGMILMHLDKYEGARAYEAEREFCLKTAFELFDALEAIRREVENEWRPEAAAKVIPLLPKLKRATT